MGTLYLVRHGQASLGAANYDCLSPLGQQQSQRLGAYWAARGLGFDAVLIGGLQRHAQTWAGIAQGLGAAQPQATVWPGLNEYDSDAVVHSVQPGADTRPRTPEAARTHFRVLRQGLLQWAQGTRTPAGMPPYADFAQGVRAVLDHVRTQCHGKVLLVSSGGPIATAVALTLQAPPESFVELNLRLRNTALTELVFKPSGLALHSFNHLPHLDGAAYADWISYA